MNTPQTDNTATVTADPEIDLMKIAQDADNGLDTPATSGTDANAQPDATDETEATGKPDDASQDPAKPAEKGKEAKPGEEPENKGEKLTAFEKAKREKERAERLLAGFQKEKEQFRAERAKIDAEIRTLRAEVAAAKKRTTTSGPARDSRGLTESDYTELAKKYEAEGNDQMAKAAREAAEELRAKAPQTTEQPTAERFEDPEFQAKWQRNIQTLYDQDPTLTDPSNPVVKATNLLLQDPQFGKFFRTDSDGIKAAHEVALLMREANAGKDYKTQVTAKDAELKKASAEIARLNALLQPRGSLPTKPASGEKKIEDMSADEADAQVRAIAEAADRGEI